MALFTRRIVRGKSTPFQLIAATLLTAQLVFVPELNSRARVDARSQRGPGEGRGRPVE